MQITIAVLDIFVCYLICQMIYDQDITSMIERDGHQRELHDTVSSNDSSSSF